MTFAERANAKLNLFLHVGKPLPSGRHPLDSLVIFPELGDDLSFGRADGLHLSVTGPFADALPIAPGNLCLRAARALADHAGIDANAQISLSKNLPVASGIGGGSADAAATLRGLARLWKLTPSPADLAQIAAGLGADVPVCVAGKPARMGGTGEALTKPPLLPPEIPVVLVNPGLAVSTAEAFAQFDASGSGDAFGPHRFPDCGSMAALVNALTRCRNDLEPAAIALCPVIVTVLAALRALPRVRLVRMAGSGATCFALFDRALEAQAAARALSQSHPQWWVHSASAHG